MDSVAAVPDAIGVRHAVLSINLAVAARGAEGTYFRAYHFARHFGSRDATKY